MSGERRRHLTLDDVAEAVGVSRATVSNAYNRPDQLSAPLRQEILRVAKRLGYTGPNPTERSLATRRAGAIAFMLDTGLSAAFSDPALSITLDALAAQVDPEGYALLLLPGGDDGGPRAGKGRIAGQLCLDLVAGSHPPKSTVLEVELVVRDSTGSAPR